MVTPTSDLTIKNIEVSGNKKIEKDAILTKITSKVGAAYSAKDIRADVEDASGGIESGLGEPSVGAGPAGEQVVGALFCLVDLCLGFGREVRVWRLRGGVGSCYRW